MLDIPTDADDIVLPGSYEAGPKDSGTEHSRQKLVLAAQDLQPHLPSGSSSSSSPVTIQSLPCTEETETWSYRCKCTFQIVAVGSNGAGEDPTNSNSYDKYVYAMRTQGQAVPLGSSKFPIATRRIQTAMQQLSDQVFLPNNPHKYSAIRQGLTSVTFSSSWYDTPEADCIVTLMYGTPLADEQQLWKTQARDLCQALGLRQLYGSAKKTIVAALDPSSRSTLRDSVYLQWNSSSSSSSDWAVTLTAPSPMTSMIHVKYEKPYDAFYHPNANAMKDALQWMLHRLTWIRQAGADDDDDVGSASSSPPLRQRLNLLELYCGCGAHTVALAKSGVLQNILVIELDPRLIQACHDNVQLNGLRNDNTDDDDDDDLSSSSCGVQIIQGDAGTWAKHSYKWTTQHYTILLVDPPRAGLDPAVCDMAMRKGSTTTSRFEHVLYISCGHAALLRDLERLSTTFDIIHLCQLDLFPRTDSIETLVHLQRKTTF